MAGERYFPEEILQCCEPDLHPDEGHVLLSRTQGMDALEARYHERALMATDSRHRPWRRNRGRGHPFTVPEIGGMDGSLEENNAV
jgi:hypothetical protein